MAEYPVQPPEHGSPFAISVVLRKKVMKKGIMQGLELHMQHSPLLHARAFSAVIIAANLPAERCSFSPLQSSAIFAWIK